MSKRNTLLALLCLALVLAAGCGKKAESPQAPAAAVETKAGEPENAGKIIVDEILSVFDQCVAEAAALAKDKPEAAVLLPKLEALYADYGVKMAALNARFLSLRDQNIFDFQRANGYLTDNRPKHVFQKDNVLGPAIAYYNFEKGEQAVVDMLSSRIVKLIDDAVKQ